MKKSATRPNQSAPEGKEQTFKGYARYTNMAFQMFAIIGVGVFGGLKLDQWLQIGFPVFTLVFSILSVAIAIYSAIKDLIRK